MEKNIDIAENDAKQYIVVKIGSEQYGICLLYTSPSPRDS